MLNQTTPQINLLTNDDNSQPKGRRIFRLSRLMLYVGSILLLGFFVFSYEVLFTENSLTDSLGGRFSIFHQLKVLVSGEKDLVGATEDRINVLLLGMGGEGHDGPMLTDTLMLVSIQPSTKKVAMVSIPRDLLVEIPNYGWWKINNANHFGEKNGEGQGGELASQVVSTIFGIPVHYYIRIDFAGFKQAIDDLGGVKVLVDRSFTDLQYPAPYDKYQMVSFTAGMQTMDGETALTYVRSRHGNNGEGSDFARSKRQQKVIQAFKDRVLSYTTLFNPNKISKLIKAFGSHIKTNMELADINNFLNLSKELDTQNAITIVLSDGPKGYLFASKVNEAYVLQPTGGNYSQLQFAVQNIFQSQQVIAPKPTATLEIKNGTKIPGLAQANADKIKSLGLKVIKTGNAQTQDYTSTVVYDLTETPNSEIGTIVKSQFRTELERDVPEWVREEADLSTDYYVILGQNAATP